MNERHAVIRSLVAARTSIEAALDLLGEGEPAGCQHPPAQREDLTGFGDHGPHWRCRACGHEEGGVSAAKGDGDGT